MQTSSPILSYLFCQVDYAASHQAHAADAESCTEPTGPLPTLSVARVRAFVPSKKEKNEEMIKQYLDSKAKKSYLILSQMKNAHAVCSSA